MRSSVLRHQATIRETTLAQDESGEAVDSWADISATPDMRIQEIPLKGDELFKAQQVFAKATIKIRMRYRSDITPKNQLIIESRTLNIHSVVNVMGRGKVLELLCSEAI